MTETTRCHGPGPKSPSSHDRLEGHHENWEAVNLGAPCLFGACGVSDRPGRPSRGFDEQGLGGAPDSIASLRHSLCGDPCVVTRPTQGTVGSAVRSRTLVPGLLEHRGPISQGFCLPEPLYEAARFPIAAHFAARHNVHVEVGGVLTGNNPVVLNQVNPVRVIGPHECLGRSANCPHH